MALLIGYVTSFYCHSLYGMDGLMVTTCHLILTFAC